MLRLLRPIETLLILVGILPKRKWDPPIRIIMPADRGVDFELSKVYSLYRTNYKVVSKTSKKVTLEVVIGEEPEFDLTMEEQ